MSACNRADLSVIPHGATLQCIRFSIRHYTRAWMSVQFCAGEMKVCDSQHWILGLQYRVYLLLPNLCELSFFGLSIVPGHLQRLTIPFKL